MYQSIYLPAPNMGGFRHIHYLSIYLLPIWGMCTLSMFPGGGHPFGGAVPWGGVKVEGLELVLPKIWKVLGKVDFNHFSKIHKLTFWSQSKIRCSNIISIILEKRSPRLRFEGAVPKGSIQGMYFVTPLKGHTCYK